MSLTPKPVKIKMIKSLTLNRLFSDGPPPAPPEDQIELAGEKLDLFEFAHGRSKFSSSGDGRVAESSTLSARYGIGKIAAFRPTDGQDRRYLFEDIRRTDQLNVPRIRTPSSLLAI